MKAIVFPGQGSQYVGMGKDFYDNFNEAKEVFHKVDDALGFKLSNIILNGPKETLDLTENTQPAIMTVGVAIYKVLKKQKINYLKDYSFFAGHSLGEYTSLICSGSLTLEDGAKILKERGKSMQESVAVNIGAMAAVLGAEIDLINEVINKNKSIEGVAEISNDNCPGQIVISGNKDKITKIVDELKNNYSKKAILLPVSAPFHCSLMQPSADKMNQILIKTNFLQPEINIVSNVTAKKIDNFKEIPSLLTKQITHHVRWRESVDFMTKNGVKHFSEIGPGKALTGMIKRINKELTTTTIDNITQFNEFN
ncbi:MAG: [acyl-carrier-protein] S-malonyltransferase [Proteobacteria bacterium]|jgi:[acyl-carrier-protein] S-malonyltransferase|nr:ACP S-malonyltransferase [Alphaproteobacteria bacterium]NBV93517.1 [acyl-carrier-protein] S-malonyltransferase [Candidatus Fonsibacter sp. PEL4]NBZ97575.1 [acyl-carrier-protein] S-malonyltransferase [Candidatus Fonsibacter sp. PEL4]